MGDAVAKAALQKQIDEWQKTAARYRSEPETREGSEQLSERARHAEEERDLATAKNYNVERFIDDLAGIARVIVLSA